MEPHNLVVAVYRHGVKLGIPPEVFPSEQFIEKIGRTNNCTMLNYFLDLTDTKQVVKVARMNILVQDKCDNVSSKNKNSLIQSFTRIKKSKEKLAEVKKLLAKAKNRETKLHDEIFETDVRIEKLKIPTESNKVKVEIMRAKVEQLEEKIEEGIVLEEKIKRVTTLEKHSSQLRDDEVYSELLRCMKLLQQFYNESMVDQETSKVWDEMRKTFHLIPNIFTFSAILKGLDSADGELKHQINHFSHEKSSKSLKMLIAKLNQRVITSAIICNSRKNKINSTKLLCGKSIQNLTNQLEGMLNQSFEYSFQYEDDSIGDFVAVTLRQLDLQGKLNKANSLLNELQLQNSMKVAEAKDLNTRILDTQKIEKLTAEKFSHFQQIIAQSFLMNSKLQNCKLSMVHLVQDLKNKNKFHQMSLAMNLSVAGETEFINHVAEVQAFTSANFEKFGVASPTIEFEMKRNRLIKVDESIPLLIKHSFGDIFGTIRNLLDLINNDFKEKQKFSPIIVKNKTKVRQQIVVETAELRKQLEINRNSVTEKCDLISSVNADTTNVLSDNKRIYNYVLTNPIKAFIPFAKKVGGKNFKAYENEFNLYYRMIKDNE